MKKFTLALNPDQILAISGGEYQGADDLTFNSVSDPGDADRESVVFVEQDKFVEIARLSSAGLIFCTPEVAPRLPERNLILHPKPYFAFLRLVSWWLEQCAVRPAPGIHPTAVVDSSATLDASASVGANTVIGENCSIGESVCIGANCSIGANVRIGKSTRLYPNTVIYDDCEIGEQVIIHSGAVIGADGFGFILMQGIQHKIPQIGNVRICNNVEVGANTTIDRGAFVSTVIGEGTKLDNLVQIGHNCQIGKHCIICALTGLAGSTVLGDYVYLAGQVGIGSTGHLKVGNRVMVGAQSGVTADLPDDARVWGTPARDIYRLKRIIASQKYLPEMYQQFLKQQKNQGTKD